MNPFPGVANEIKVQVEVEKRESGWILLHGVLDEVRIGILIIQKNFQGFDPRFVDLFPANTFIAVTEMQPHEPNELFRIPVFYRLPQIRNGHVLFPLFLAKRTFPSSS